jgi:hemolysin III
VALSQNVISKLRTGFRELDHVAIFLLIVGTYTLFTFGVLRGACGWTLFMLVGLAALTFSV